MNSFIFVKNWFRPAKEKETSSFSFSLCILLKSWGNKHEPLKLAHKIMGIKKEELRMNDITVYTTNT